MPPNRLPIAPKRPPEDAPEDAGLLASNDVRIGSAAVKMFKTDEVFVLLKGKATLYIGENREPAAMEINKLYNVTAGTWHNIVCDEEASVLVIENSDTNKANTEYIDL